MRVVMNLAGLRANRRVAIAIAHLKNYTTIGKLNILMTYWDASGLTDVVFQSVARDGRYVSSSFLVAEAQSLM